MSQLGKCVYCGAKIDSMSMVCPDCMPKYYASYESDVRGYFVCCPLCGSDNLKPHFIQGGRDTLTCENCEAKWHLHVGLTGLKWAELDLVSKDKKGLQLLGKRLDKKEWRNMATEIQRTMPRPNISKKPIEDERKSTLKEKEIIREKEVIVKIRCSYCHNLHDETLDKCPYCGAKR